MWSSEAQFADSFETHLQERVSQLQRRGKGAIVLREYEPGYGRVDVTYVIYDLERLQRRIAALDCNSAAFDKNSAYALAFLSGRRWVSVKGVAKAIDCNLTETKNILKILEQKALIEMRNSSVKAKARNFSWVIDRIIAFELKLENWRRAIEQAGRHLWFASQSFIVMPGRSKLVATRLSETCAARKIGSIFCFDRDDWKVISSPPHASVPVSYVGWLLNEAIVAEGHYA